MLFIQTKKDIFMYKKLYLAAIIIASATPQLWGQNTLVSTDSTAKAEVQLSEVIISASRDESKLKDIPGSITSIRSGQIENNQIQSLEDISAFAPNFMMLDYGTKIVSPVYIRGIGSKKSSVGPSVGLYVDGVPYYDNSALTFDFYDISGVEVLRGPQGTLYGRNTIGGLINVNTLSPLNYQGTNVSLTAGQYGKYNGSISHYGQSGKLAYSIAANGRQEGGYYTNEYDNKNADAMSSYGLRNRLIYQINDKLSIENIFSFENSKQDGYAYAVQIDSVGGSGEVEYDEPQVNYNQESGYKRFMLSNGFKLNYEEEKWIANASLSYHRTSDHQFIDQDFSTDSVYFVDQNQSQNQYSAEGIIRSTNTDKYSWMFGAYGFKQSVDKTVDVEYYAYPYNASKDLSSKTYLNTNISSGAFHQSKWSPIKDLTITAGIRLNYESSQLDYTENNLKGSTQSTVLDTSFSTLTELIILPKIALAYEIENTTIYASYSTGYKPGGFNTSFITQDQIKFTNETSHNYEVGFKTTLLNGLIYSDFSVFNSKIKGQQITRSLVSSTGTVIGSYIDNSGISTSKGFEYSLSTKPINGYEASIGYGYTKADIVDYQKNSTTDYSGNITPFVPNHTLNIIFAKTFETKSLTFIDNIRFQGNIQQIGDIYWNLENTMQQDAYSLVNGLISFKYNNFKLDIWGRNLFDTDYNTYMFSLATYNTSRVATNRWYGQQGQPRNFGTTLSLKF